MHPAQIKNDDDLSFHTWPATLTASGSDNGNGNNNGGSSKRRMSQDVDVAKRGKSSTKQRRRNIESAGESTKQRLREEKRSKWRQKMMGSSSSSSSSSDSDEDFHFGKGNTGAHTMNGSAEDKTGPEASNIPSKKMQDTRKMTSSRSQRRTQNAVKRSRRQRSQVAAESSSRSQRSRVASASSSKSQRARGGQSLSPSASSSSSVSITTDCDFGRGDMEEPETNEVTRNKSTAGSARAVEEAKDKAEKSKELTEIEKSQKMIEMSLRDVVADEGAGKYWDIRNPDHPFCLQYTLSFEQPFKKGEILSVGVDGIGGYHEQKFDLGARVTKSRDPSGIHYYFMYNDATEATVVDHLGATQLEPIPLGQLEEELIV